MKNKLPLKVTVRKYEHDVLMVSGAKSRTIPLDELSDKRISQVFDDFGYVDDDPSSVDAHPVLVSVSRDQPRRGAVTLEVYPKKTAIVKDAINPKDWDAAFKVLGISCDDYAEFCKWLEEHGLPEHANAHLTHWDPDRELTIKNLNEFGFPIEKPEIDPSLFVDEKLSIPDLFEFQIDINAPLFHIDEETRKSIQELFEFNPEKKQK